MNVRTIPQQAASPATPAVASKADPGRRWWKGVAAACLPALPLGWLLGYGALLPFYLGLYFFALFGLAVGATACRVASPGRPYSRPAVVAGTLVLVAVVWCMSMICEARAFPRQMAAQAARQAKVSDLAGRDIDTYREDMHRNVRAYLTREYPPGGIIGYVRWAAASSVLRSRSIEGLRGDIASTQSRYGFVVRAALSLALLWVALGSQTMPLTKPKVESRNPKPEIRNPQSAGSAEPQPTGRKKK